MESNQGMAKQGDMGKLDSKTEAELIDLLNRQQKLLSNTKRLELLPDKGQKVKLLADKLQQLIADYATPMDDTAYLFDQLDIGTPKTAPRAVKNAFLKTDPPISNFKPYRTLKTDKLSDLGEGFERPQAPPSRVGTPRQKVEGQPPEVSAVSIPPLRHPGTQALNVKEAGDLLQTQKSKVEALLAQQAAERLAERLDIRMGEYKPLTPGRYRDPETDSDDSSDEEDDEDDKEEEEEEEKEKEQAT